MSIVIELPPAEEAQVTDAATREGVSVGDLIKKAIRSYLPEIKNPVSINAATIALMKQWEEEDAKLSQEEREKVNRMYDEIERNGIPRISI
jgi:hypothetical protein